MPTKIDSPSTLRMLGTSCLPHNCAVKMAAPLVTPNRNRDSKKKIWFARPAAAMEASPSWPIRMTPTMFSEDMTNCCRAMGRAICTRRW